MIMSSADVLSNISSTNTIPKDSSSSSASSLPPLLCLGATRHTLAAQEELRLETTPTLVLIQLQKGSAELFGVELALQKPYTLSDGANSTAGLKLALFTWHGCVLDVYVKDDEHHLESAYVTDETHCNIAYVNTHAQLEAMRDVAAASSSSASASAAKSSSSIVDGPRVLICGPQESGKSSLTKVLSAYATKLGRTPLLVDLDPCDTLLSVPGTLSVCALNREAVTVPNFAAVTTPPLPGTGAVPLVLWHGTSNKLSVDLFREQVSALGRKIDQRLSDPAADWERSSGIIVNTNGWIRDEGYQLLLHAVKALRINVVLVMGNDRLYSMMKKDVASLASNMDDDATTATTAATAAAATADTETIKVIKVPRSGGVVSRDASFLRQSKSRTIKRYFYGDMVADSAATKSDNNAATTTSSSTSTSTAGVTTSSSGLTAMNIPRHVTPRLTPFLLQIPFAQVTIYKFASISLSASLLPVAAAQATDPVQLVQVTITEKLQHALLAVCHPQMTTNSGGHHSARDFYEHGVAGFCAVERVMMDTERLHLLCPCAGSLPSNTLLLGDITWME